MMSNFRTFLNVLKFLNGYFFEIMVRTIGGDDNTEKPRNKTIIWYHHQPFRYFISKQKTLELSQSGIGLVMSWNLAKSYYFFTNFMKPSQGISTLSQSLVKKRVISIFMKLVKRLCFCPDFCFLWIKCYFVITPMFTRMFTFWNFKSG